MTRPPHPRRRRLAVVVAALCLASAGGGQAAIGATAPSPGIPNAEGRLTACYERAAGRLRLIDRVLHQGCYSTETFVSWSQIGPRGAPGTPGTPGPAVAPAARIASDLDDDWVDVGAPTQYGTEVQRLDLPAGTYALTAKGAARNVQGENLAVCRLLQGEEVLDVNAVNTTATGQVPFSLVTVATVPAGPVRISCLSTSEGEMVGLTSIVAMAVSTS